MKEKLLQIAQEISPLINKKFYLAGGTAIMFKYSHRISTDLDFFSYTWFSAKYLVKKISDNFHVTNIAYLGDNTDLFIDNVKISLVYFPFKNIKRTELYKNVKIASDYDLFLNKIYVAGRRIDPKDPFDIAFLYGKHKWDKTKIKQDFERKFPSQSYEIYLGAILDFDSYKVLDEATKTKLIELSS